MMEEEHRHEERQHKKKERTLDKKKRQEDRRRKKWEEFEKCLEREADEEVDLGCQEPEFHQQASQPKKTHNRRHRHASVEPVETEPFDIYEDEEDGAWTDDYDFRAPFNGAEEHH